MPTYRKLHTKALESQDLADMPDDLHRLAWLLLPLILSREGTTIYQPHYLCSKLFPLRSDVTDDMMHGVFTWFLKRGMIQPYTANGRTYLWVPTFTHYQGECDKESPSQFPPVPDEVLTYSRPTPDLLQRKSSLDIDVDVDSHADTDAQTDSSPAKAMNQSAPIKRVIDHETVPEPELLRELHKAFQRGTGQAETDALPSGAQRQALRQLLDDKRTAADIEAYTRFLKTGWWSDKILPVTHLPDGVGQWIAQGRPAKANGKARASPRRSGNWTKEELAAARAAEDAAFSASQGGN